MIKQAKSILKETFGFDHFRPLQENVIKNVLAKRDSLIIMPTGGGKSLCYQIPAMIFDGLTIVVSPLISLMKDQVDQLTAYGIPAVVLNSSISDDLYRLNVQKVRSGKAKMLYVAPESLMTERIRNLLTQVNVDCFTIDEAHCISEWGHDFRPDYRQLAEIRKDFPEAVCLGLTATATPRVRDDIKKILEFRDASTFVASFDRENLFLNVVDKAGPVDQILDFLYTRKGQSGIIYCFSRRQTDELYQDLKDEGHSVRPYHAGLSEHQRETYQNAFIRDDIDIIVATVAFGMGIDKPDVRFVIHHDMPQNIESYYQQIGRAGRDGLRSDCLLLYSHSDRQKINYFINQKEGEEKEVAKKHLEDLIDYLLTDECRRIPLMKYFGESYGSDTCEMCDNCISMKDEMEDLTVAAQKFLSCIVRTEERYGATHITDILCGSKAKKVLENGHNDLSTYGIGEEFSKDQWVQLSRLLVRKDFLKKDPKYGSLILTDAARKVLKDEQRVTGVLDRTQTAIDGNAASRTSTEVENRYDENLFHKLRKIRKEMASEQDVPPYVIFPDTTLMEMSFYFPQSPETLGSIYGVGESKQKKYGPEFLSAIKAYCEENDIEEREREIRKKKKKKSSSKKHHQIGRDYNNGKSLDHLAEEHGVKMPTILKHLKTYLEEGNDLRQDGILKASGLSQRKVDEVIQSMDKVGPELLKPVYENLDKSVGYSELRMMQLYYLAKNGN
ncbi:DNA helicase RecQ [soil metagenome]